MLWKVSLNPDNDRFSLQQKLPKIIRSQMSAQQKHLQNGSKLNGDAPASFLN